MKLRVGLGCWWFVVLASQDCNKGIVVAAKANYLQVELDSINTQDQAFVSSDSNNLPRLLCTLRSRLNHLGSKVYVGDIVTLEQIDWDTCRAVISDVEPRKNQLNRPSVANVSQLAVVIALKEPAFAFDQASRFLLAAEHSGINVCLVLTKRDLIEPKELNVQLSRLSDWGYQPIAVSIKTGEGIDSLLLRLRSSKLTVLCGPSGVGKSSLLNYFLPGQTVRVGGLSGKLRRGQHTTRNVELYSIGDSSLVADSPGFNRPELSIVPHKLSLLFPELRNQLEVNNCKFRDCLHRDEPGCVVEKNWERYAHYRKCLEELISFHH